MAKAKKLPSGNWRAQVYIGKDATGKRLYESVTASSKKEAEYMAAQVQMGIAQRRESKIALLDACREFIAARTNVISPRTLGEYIRIAEKDLAPLHRVFVCDITADNVQRFINLFAATHSPKTVRNVHAFLGSVLAQYAPDLHLDTKLPPRQKQEIAIPTQENIVSAVRLADDHMKAVILLASNLGMRRGEICALTWADVQGNMISVTKSMAKTIEKKWIVKPPKTAAGTRTLPASDAVAHALAAVHKASDKPSDFIFPFTPDAITHRWETLCKHGGFTCRFHDLRHYNASVMLALGVPDKYAMGRMGHSTTNMLKSVYQHLQQEKEKAFSTQINAFFDEMQHEKQHEN